MDIFIKNNMIVMRAYQSRTRKGKRKIVSVFDTREKVDLKDQVHLSEFIKELNGLSALARTLPCIDEKRVRDILDAMEKGEYSIHGQLIAFSMLKNTFENNVILNGEVAYV